MDFDQKLLDGLQSQDQLPVVRIYSWSAPAVTYGRLQELKPVQDKYPGIECVRRPTGGKAVLHGSDLTMSVIALNEHLAEGETSVRRAYTGIVESVRRALTATGTFTQPGTSNRTSSHSVGCFESAAECDLVETKSGLKLVGCAQRRTKCGSIIQVSIPNHQNDWNLLAEIRNNLEVQLNVSCWVSR